MKSRRLIFLFLSVLMGCNGSATDAPSTGGAGSEACGADAECGRQLSAGTTPASSQFDLCDNMDNDADGKIDEDDSERVCNTRCGSGRQVCTDGSWSDCDAPPPLDEQCDKQDNDCDGRVDEALTQSCDTPCGMGIQTCRLGVWSTCEGPSVSKEVCDNLDNDCDGMIDENLLEACVSDCANGYQRCVQGVFGDCDARQPSQEVCGDLIDNDCDGNTDEMCDCNPGQMRSCSTSTGACEAGIQICEGNGIWSPCLDEAGALVQSPGQTPETCNTVDDDCNGITDDVPSMPCGPEEVGICRKGLSQCRGGVNICEGEVTAKDEICDRKDNDCDGVVDEGLVNGERDARDAYEPNPRCEVAESLGVISHASRTPRGISGSLYPVGDEDWYRIEVSEGRNFCVPFVGPSDPSYELRIDLSDLPPDADYRVCAHLSNIEEPANAGCLADRRTTPVKCSEGANANGLQSLSFTVDGRCGSDDSVMLFIRVYAPVGTSTFCEPYTLSISSRQL